MNRELRLDETLRVSRPRDEAFAYVADFARIAEWDPAVLRAARLTDGPVAVGSEFLVELRGGLSLHYSVVELEQGARLKMTVASRAFSALEEITFSTVDAVTVVRYVATFSFALPAAVLARLFPGAMERAGKRAVSGLARALEDREPVPALGTMSRLADALVVPGVLRFTRLGHESARKSWGPVSASVRGRHVVLTGATSGLGLATARELAHRGCDLTLVARDAGKASRVVAELTRQTGNRGIRAELAELSSLAEIHALADRLVQSGRPIDVLVNNAGALLNTRELTPEGNEKSFALLLLGPTALTERLRPVMRSPGGRVVNVLSGGMYAERVDVDDLQSERGPYSGEVAYARAKRGLLIMTEVWAERWASSGIVVNAMHPGWADTPGVEVALPRFRRVLGGLLRTPEEGADTIIWLCVASEAGRATGRLWLDRLPRATHLSSRTRETEAERERLVARLGERMARPPS